MHNIQNPKDGLWFFSKKNHREFENRVLDTSDVGITLYAEYKALTHIEKAPYKKLAQHSYDKYISEVRVATHDAEILTATIRAYSAKIICILISYNVIYTWVIGEGILKADWIKDNIDSVPGIIQFAAKPGFFLLNMYETTLKYMGIGISNAVDSISLFLGVFLFVTYTGILQAISKGFSKLMVNSLTALLTGKYSKSALIYMVITLVWMSDLATRIMANPLLISGGVFSILIIGVFI